MILSAETEGEKAIQYVGGLLERLDELQKKAYSFKAYQKTFKVGDCMVKMGRRRGGGRGGCASVIPPTPSPPSPHRWR